MLYAWTHSARFASARTRLPLAGAPLVAYVLIFFTLFYASPAGPSAINLSGVGVAAAGWLLGHWAGLASGLLAIPLNFALLLAVGIKIDDAAAFAGNGAIVAANLAIGWMVGWMGELYRRVQAQARELECKHEALIREVAERNQAEERLRDSEELFRLITENVGDMISFWDPESKLVYCSPAYARTFGREPAATLQVALADLYTPDDSGARKMLERAMKGEREPLTIRMRELDGSRRWIEATGSLVEMRGASYLMVVARDITTRHEHQVELQRSHEQQKQVEAELRESQALTRRVLEAVPAGILMVSPDARVVEANDHAMRSLGLSFDQLKHLYVADSEHQTIWEDGSPCPLEEYPVTKCLRTGQAQPAVPIGVRFPDGHIFWGMFSATPARDPHTGKSAGAVVTFLDITERRELEQQLRQAQKMDAVGRLAGGVAHDFNNLLTVINGYGELLMDSLAQGEPAHGLAAEITRAGERAAALTRQLLAFGRKQVVALKPLDLNAVIAGMSELIPRLLGEHIELDTQLAEYALAVKADPTQIEQVVVNLAVNARDAMPEGGRLTIATAAVAISEAGAQTAGDVRAGLYVLLEMRDTGAGMTEAVRSRLFEPFFTTKGVGKGTGLGLATVYGIVKQSGGHVEVQTAPGRGTTFRVYLPHCAEPVQAVEPTPPSAAPRGGGEVILVAEDEPLVRSLAARGLRMAGYHVLEALTAPEAARLCEHHDGPIDLLLTDVIMPQLNGPALAKQAQKVRAGLRVLFMSGHTDDAVLRRGIRDDGVPFLPKPFTLDALARKVREVLDA